MTHAYTQQRLPRYSTRPVVPTIQLAMVSHLDHLVLTCADLPTTIAWYTRVLGFTHREHNGRHALHFGEGTTAGKLNLHQSGREIEPHAHKPTPGSADLCFVSPHPTDWWLDHLLTTGVVILEGPVTREGARGPMQSIYVRDPDLNLIEIAHYPA